MENVTWKATFLDGTILFDVKKYREINRDNLKNFELLFTNTTSFGVETKGKTLVYRMKTRAKATTHSTKLTPMYRVKILALLQKNKDDTKNIKYEKYSIDPDLSEIYYIFADGSVIKRKAFGVASPYLPLELFPEELEHLIGE